jgi:hypothetical protein
MPCFPWSRPARCAAAVLSLLHGGAALAAPPEPAAPTVAAAHAAAPSANAPSARQAASGSAFRLSHHSAFSGYTRHSDTPVGPWREVNDTVQRVGGWRAYAREAAAPSPAASASGSAGGLK